MKNPTTDTKQPLLKGWRTIITGYVTTTIPALYALFETGTADITDPHFILDVVLLAGGPVIQMFYNKK